MKFLKVSTAVLGLTLMSGCLPPEQMIQEAKVFLKKYGIELKTTEPVKTEIVTPGIGTPAPNDQTAGQLAKENSEILAEMLKVVFDVKDIDDKSDFGNLVHTLNQGASLEGIYRGIISGSRYRALESKSQAASPTELKAFAIEMAELQDTMKNPSVFESDSAKKAPSIDFPDGKTEIAVTPEAHEGSQEVEKKKDKAVRRDEILQTFIGASGFTLKRTICNEALNKFDEMKDDRGDLAQWYGHFVQRMAESKVDFGLPLRNDPNFDFHFKFAQTMSLDRVKWEVLNRYHRYLNFTATTTQ